MGKTYKDKSKDSFRRIRNPEKKGRRSKLIPMYSKGNVGQVDLDRYDYAYDNGEFIEPDREWDDYAPD